MAIDISHYFKTIIPWAEDALEFSNQLLLDPLNSVRLLNTAFIRHSAVLLRPEL